MACLLHFYGYCVFVSIVGFLFDTTTQSNNVDTMLTARSTLHVIFVNTLGFLLVLLRLLRFVLLLFCLFLQQHVSKTFWVNYHIYRLYQTIWIACTIFSIFISFFEPKVDEMYVFIFIEENEINHSEHASIAF